MGNTTIMVVCLLTAVYLGIVIAGEKSHNMYLTRVDTPVINKTWIDLHQMAVTKFNKIGRMLTLNFTALHNLDSNDILCEIKIYQKMEGNNYKKAPMDIPKQPCCEFFPKNKVIWSCVQKKSSFPEKCPIKKGKHWVKEINPDECNPADNFPPGMPEDYKATVTLSKGPILIFKVTGYGKLKKKLMIG